MLADLPIEIILKILGYCGTKDLSLFRLSVCQKQLVPRQLSRGSTCKKTHFCKPIYINQRLWAAIDYFGKRKNTDFFNKLVIEQMNSKSDLFKLRDRPNPESSLQRCYFEFFFCKKLLFF